MIVVVLANADISTLPTPMDVDDPDNTKGDDYSPLYVAATHDPLEMETVLKTIKIDYNSDYSAIFKEDYIPMYVKTGTPANPSLTIPTGPFVTNHYINDTSSGTTQTYYLLRSVAKVKIDNNRCTGSTPPAGLYTFDIENVYVMNGKAEGNVCHDDDALKVDRVKEVTQNGTIANATSDKEKNKLTPGAVTPAFKQTVADFYLYEAKVTNPGPTKKTVDRAQDCHLIITGKRGNETTTTSYMIPFPYLGDGDNSSIQGTFDWQVDGIGSVLRNHYYQFTIEGVTKTGLLITLAVRPWTDININANPIFVP